ncbi:MAG TPA: diiron oxygenase [Herpetosiphonaceae bacterium]
MGSVHSEPAQSEYTSKLQDWDTRAAVRAKPRRILQDEESQGKLYFPTELVPLAQHPTITNLGPSVARQMVVQHLYTYLDFTTLLEHDVVNVVAHEIAHEKIGFALPREMVFDAYKLYCDEAYHALFSVDLKLQVAAATGVDPLPGHMPSFLQRLRILQESVPRDLQQLAEVFFTIVSETLISATLAQIPRDPRVVSAVREVVADHAEDEGRHHAYFSSLLQILWPQLTPQQQQIIGPLLPEFILGFLEPDYAAATRALTNLDLSSRSVEQILQEVYQPDQVLTNARAAAAATLRLFDRNGVLDEPHTAEAFFKSGLIK